MINTDVQQNQHCGSAVCIYVAVIEHFDKGRLSSVVTMETIERRQSS